MKSYYNHRICDHNNLMERCYHADYLHCSHHTKNSWSIVSSHIIYLKDLCTNFEEFLSSVTWPTFFPSKVCWIHGFWFEEELWDHGSHAQLHHHLTMEEDWYLSHIVANQPTTPTTTTTISFTSTTERMTDQLMMEMRNNSLIFSLFFLSKIANGKNQVLSFSYQICTPLIETLISSEWLLVQDLRVYASVSDQSSGAHSEPPCVHFFSFSCVSKLFLLQMSSVASSSSSASCCRSSLRQVCLHTHLWR